MKNTINKIDIVMKYFGYTTICVTVIYVGTHLIHALSIGAL